MVSDPYQVLGVSHDASDDEIKAAYRRLAKKYHPDLHPGDQEAARKMNEINSAYDQIKNPQAQQQAAGGYGGGPYSGSYARGYGGGYGWGGGYSWGGAGQYGAREETERNELRAARNYIRARHFTEAVTALTGVPYGERDGEWHYLYAIASFHLGNRMEAMEAARRAVELSPGNAMYRQLLEQLESGGMAYEQTGAGYGYQPMGFSGGNLCLRLCLLNLMCNICGLGGFRFIWC